MERYRHLIPDYEKFLRVVQTPAPTVIRANTLKTSPEVLAARLKKIGYSLSALGWDPWLFTVPNGESISSTLEHWLGHFYIQEATSALAVHILDPQPGEIILDLCAAPGGKTTHIAQKMQDKGLIIANDRTEKRLRALHSNLTRLGVTIAAVTETDGRRFPDLGIPFDRVLVDAPCSSEGRVRDQPQLLEPVDPSFLRYIISVQKGLLRRALELIKVGGVVVYATCTFAPEENEGVVSYALQRLPCELVSIELPVPGHPGVTEWNGLRWNPEVVKCVRVYPHDVNSGGLFAAKFRRL